MQLLDRRLDRYYLVWNVHNLAISFQPIVVHVGIQGWIIICQPNAWLAPREFRLSLVLIRQRELMLAA